MSEHRKPDHLPQDIWDVCYFAWLDTEDKRPSEMDEQDFKAIDFAANRVFYNQGRKWMSLPTDELSK